VFASRVRLFEVLTEAGQNLRSVLFIPRGDLPEHDNDGNRFTTRSPGVANPYFVYVAEHQVQKEADRVVEGGGGGRTTICDEMDELNMFRERCRGLEKALLLL
jgi:hypothetical protein